MNSLKLKRHETFSIREGWIEKAINLINENESCFSKLEATAYLGIGSNMVKSLRYWLMASGIAQFRGNGIVELTEFGNLLLEYDRYLDRTFSWWLIHQNLVTNFDDAPVFNVFFNLDIDRFSKEFIKAKINDWFIMNDYEIGAESSLDSDVSILLKSYYSEDTSDPENNLNCPLGKLHMLEKKDRTTYVKNITHYDELNYLVIYRLMVILFADNFKINGKETNTFNAEDMLDIENSPLKMFNITKSSFFAYLEEMQNNQLITFTKTAGLNTVTIERFLTDRDIFRLYFHERMI